MNLILQIGGKLLNFNEYDMVEMDRAPGNTVRIQFRNRRDEVSLIGGKPVTIKHGVVELPEDLSEKFRWFIEVFGASYGIQNVDALYEQRAIFERLKKLNDARQLYEVESRLNVESLPGESGSSATNERKKN